MNQNTTPTDSELTGDQENVLWDILRSEASPTYMLEMIQKLIARSNQLAALEAQLDLIDDILKYWFDLQTVVPRLQSSPPPVKQHIHQLKYELIQARDAIVKETK